MAESSATSTQSPTNAGGGSGQPPIRALFASLPHRHKAEYCYRAPDAQIDHVVIGGGIVGLSIAAALSQRWPEKTTVLIERNSRGGLETSSRGSKVVHAGIYYPADSLKTRLCLRGKHLLYQYCEKFDLPYRKTGKLVVGPPTEQAQSYLSTLHQHAQSLKPLTPPTKLLTGDEARALEPSLSDTTIGHALLSESTGIVGAAEVVKHLHSRITDSPAGELVLGTSVIRVDPHSEGPASSSSGKRGSDSSQSGWVIQTAQTVLEQRSGLAAPPTREAGSESTSQPVGPGGAAVSGPSETILARVVINASGLNANLVLNSLVEDGVLPGDDEEIAPGESDGKRGIPMYYAKGNYVRAEGGSAMGIQHLIYPLPDMGQEGGKNHAHQGLGTHLTLDMAGNIIFGPDVEWITPPQGSKTTGPEAAIDFWSSHLHPSPARLSDMHEAITSYLPAITLDSLKPAWAGIRPKLVGPEAKEFRDFEILWHSSRDLGSQNLWQRALPDGFDLGPEGQVRPRGGDEIPESGGGAMISLLGIESPGLTSSMGIAELVEELIAQRVWGDHNTHRVKGAQNEEIGNLDDWA
ncbi:unnamed protein product [Tilletia controversa]|uniref:L-2-hydroxyglutarate dehydrogenase, mitochondrial n=3 Tax=Tilletia TaxID=13289 RepID=A0A8X7MZJ2_9BASI|nr:hypothetical protein CF336_g747 [Tilletia laevis]KAE8253462.1 hypothetical protein A4X06_0g1439 [Tilletia controversa]KAE8265201.1 hypothetical protein A4X03_0g422 [Tilletia caries]KAE8208428.1 hypothetical protein CF335_g412 [Tilletia laevis]CAD6886358.1 unnamed protein product [Tilletia caries]